MIIVNAILGLKIVLYAILNIYPITGIGEEVKTVSHHCATGEETGIVEALLPFPLWNGTNNVVYIPEGKINTLKNVEDFTGVKWEDLLSMCIQESTSCDESTIGDHGMSFGAFQIHSYWNPITDEMKKSFQLQAEWTAISLRDNGYKHNRMWAIQMHNTSNDYTMRYAKAVDGRSKAISK